MDPLKYCSYCKQLLCDNCAQILEEEYDYGYADCYSCKECNS